MSALRPLPTRVRRGARDGARCRFASADQRGGRPKRPSCIPCGEGHHWHQSCSDLQHATGMRNNHCWQLEHMILVAGGQHVDFWMNCRAMALSMEHGNPPAANACSWEGGRFSLSNSKGSLVEGAGPKQNSVTTNTCISLRSYACQQGSIVAVQIATEPLFDRKNKDHAATSGTSLLLTRSISIEASKRGGNGIRRKFVGQQCSAMDSARSWGSKPNGPRPLCESPVLAHSSANQHNEKKSPKKTLAVMLCHCAGARRL
eukprot:324463-Chlamydomonas_euryale.AAC.6